MVLYIGNEPIAGYSTNTKMNAHSLLDFKWSDHILNELSWVNADTFSWLSGDVYTAVYNKLVAEYDTGTTETETGVSYKKSDNGFKIADASQEQAVIDAYNSTGVAWFYILDTANRRFKLPRTKYNKYMSQVAVKGNRMTLGLSGVNGQKGGLQVGSGGTVTAAISAYNTQAGGVAYSDPMSITTLGITTDASKSGMVADLSTDTNMLLYFYVGEFAQSAVEQTAGINSELFNNKADVDLSNVNASGTSLASGWSMPSNRYIDLSLGASGASYTAPANGWLTLRKNSSATNQMVGLYTDSTSSICYSPTSSSIPSATLPVSKGDTAAVYYSAGGDLKYFRFTYAEGEQ